MAMGTVTVQGGIDEVERDGPYRALVTTEDPSTSFTMEFGDREWVCKYCEELVEYGGANDAGGLFTDERDRTECLDNVVTETDRSPVEDDAGNYSYGNHEGVEKPLGWLQEVMVESDTDREDVQVCVEVKELQGHLKLRVWKDPQGSFKAELTGWNGMGVGTPLNLGALVSLGG